MSIGAQELSMAVLCYLDVVDYCGKTRVALTYLAQHEMESVVCLVLY